MFISMQNTINANNVFSIHVSENKKIKKIKYNKLKKCVLSTINTKKNVMNICFEIY